MADTEFRSAVEAEIAAHCSAGDKQRAATRLLEAYGQELFRFLVSHLRDRDAAEEVFSRFTESLWRSLDQLLAFPPSSEPARLSQES